MPEAENTVLARRWFEVGHLEGLVCRGVPEFLAARSFILNAFPDIRMTVDDTAAQGDVVVVRWSVQGTHRGEFLGIAATHEPVKFRGITWLRFADGRIVEGWDAWNQGRLVTELQALANVRGNESWQASSS